MDRKYMTIFYFVLFILIFMFIFNILFTLKIKAIEYNQEEEDRVLNLVKPYPVIGIVLDNDFLYENDNNNSLKIKDIEKASEIEILMDRSEKWYFVKEMESGKCGWIYFDKIFIPKDSESNKNLMSKYEKEVFANILNFNSSSNWFIWVDIDRQVVNVFKKNNDQWNIYKEFECSSGKNASPTTRGFYKISEKGEWFYSDRLGSGARYWVRFNGSYLFHSFPMDREKNIIDYVLGERRSSGCVRLSVENAKWIFDNISENTTVFIN